MVTIEDVLEQIVGDIEDEFDYDETEDNIIQDQKRQFRVKASTEISDYINIPFMCWYMKGVGKKRAVRGKTSFREKWV